MENHNNNIYFYIFFHLHQKDQVSKDPKYYTNELELIPEYENYTNLNHAVPLPQFCPPRRHLPPLNRLLPLGVCV